MTNPTNAQPTITDAIAARQAAGICHHEHALPIAECDADREELIRWAQSMVADPYCDACDDYHPTTFGCGEQYPGDGNMNDRPTFTSDQEFDASHLQGRQCRCGHFVGWHDEDGCIECDCENGYSCD